MYCKYCGQQIPDGSKFCPLCGMDLTKTETKQQEDHTADAYVPPVQPAYVPPAYTQQAEKKKNPLFIILPIILIAALGIYFLFFAPVSIKAKDFVSVEVPSTLNGYGKAVVTIDYEKLDSIIGKDRIAKGLIKNMDSSLIREYESEYGMSMEAILDYFGLLSSEYLFDSSVENTTDLHNGDKVIVRFEPGGIVYDGLLPENATISDINKALGIRMPETYEYTVSGLSDGKEVDIFIPDIDKYVTFVGTQGHGSARFDWKDASYQIAGLYECKANANGYFDVYESGSRVGSIYYNFLTTASDEVQFGSLKENDTITVIAELDGELQEEFISNGIVPTNNTVRLTVPKLAELSDASAFSGDVIAASAAETIRTMRIYYFSSTETIYPDKVFFLKNEEAGSTAIGYLFKTTVSEHRVFVIDYDPVISSDGKSYSSYESDYFDLGKLSNDDPSTIKTANSKLSGYDFTEIDATALKTLKPAVGKTGTITDDKVIARVGPGTDYDPVKSGGKTVHYEKGEVLEIVDEAFGREYKPEEVKNDYHNGLWYKVAFYRNGTRYEYWVSGRFFALNW